MTATGPPFQKLVESVRLLGDHIGTGDGGNGGNGSENKTDEAGTGRVNAALSDLYSIEAYINKLEMMMGAYKKEQHVYWEKQTELQSSISGCMASIEACKSELEEARRKMAQAKEYEQVKQQIVKIPARSVTLLEVEGVKKEVEELKKERTAVEELTATKISQFRSILETIQRVDDELAAISMAPSKGATAVKASEREREQQDDIDID